jgi:Carboxypeptidase regulatory-like domain
MSFYEEGIVLLKRSKRGRQKAAGRRALFLILICGFVARLCVAQTFTSSITGTVVDPSGAAVSNAKVELQNAGTNDTHEFVTQADGTYQFNNLRPGTYKVTITAPGFKSYVTDNLILQGQISARVNAALEIGDTQQKVEVAGSAVLVDTETANSSATLDSKLIANLPNGTRNPLNFVFAVAGTTRGPAGMTQSNGTFDQNSSVFSLNGGRSGEEQVLIDGAPSTAVDWGGLLVSPLQDSVQEQQIVTNTYDSQYARSGSGIVTLITKGGTNTFHGEAYDYLQNSALNANSWANNKFGGAKGPFKRNQFGGNVGGPILKRANLFFFAGYEALRQPSTASTLATVPTQAERTGNFSAALNASGTQNLIYNPFATTRLSDGTFTRQAFPGNVIPTRLIDPVGAKIMSLYPLPNRTGQGSNQVNNFFSQGAASNTNDKLDSRVDWEQSATHRMFIRWSDRFRQDVINPCFYCTGGDTNVNEHDNGFQVVLNDTVTPSPTWVINTFASYGRWQEAHLAQTLGTADAATIGLSPSLFQAPILPGITVENYAGLGVSFGGGFQKYTRYANTIGMNVTKSFSRHTLKFGGNFDDQRINNVDEANAPNTGSPAFSFAAALTSCDPNPNGGPCLARNSGTGPTGNALASLLLGAGSGGGQAFNIDPAMALPAFGLYVQDQWRVTRRLTVNLGVRYENQRPATERLNRMEYFNTTVLNPISSSVGFPVHGGFEYVGVNGNSRYAWPANNHDFAPRAGIAYKITDRLVARAGAGIYFLPPSAMISFDGTGQFAGFSSSTTWNATTQNGFVPLNLVSNPFPNGINTPTGSSQGLLTFIGNDPSQVWPKAPHPTPYTEQWSFDLQYQLTTHSVFQVGYLGNRGRKLLYGNPNINIDQLPDQFLSLQSQLDRLVPNPFFGKIDPNSQLGSQQTVAFNQLLRPYPEFASVGLTRSLPGARSSYNALDVKYNHSFSNGLSALVTYRWSKALDNGPEDFIGWGTGNQWRDSYNTMLDYNISTHDVPHSFATALVYDLPYGRGKRWGNTAPAIVKEVIGNWQLSSVVRLASGLPLPQAVFWSNSNPLGNYGFPGPQIANLVGNPVPSNRTPDNWINPSAYVAPPNNWTLGNAPQRMTQLRERAARNVDLSIAKNFGGERYQAWLRAEFLNAFNYAQYTLAPFNNVQMCVTCGDFGDLNSTVADPRTIQVSLKFAF